MDNKNYEEVEDIVEFTNEEGDTMNLRLLDYFYYNGEEYAFFVDAGRLIIEKDKATIGMLQRAFRIGFNRAARIMDQLCDAGVVGEEEGTKPRRILMDAIQFENYVENNL